MFATQTDASHLVSIRITYIRNRLDNDQAPILTKRLDVLHLSETGEKLQSDYSARVYLNPTT